jgi:8-oxo-dGTP pyrophosphatase MutT (NUDIX family)
MQSGGMQPGVPLDEVQAPTHEFFERARARLTQEVPPGLTDLNAEVRIRGDLDLEPELWEKAGVTATKPAAVLVPVVARAEPMVLLTQRTPELKSHSGQVAFPGGRIDPTDASPLAAALREANEEIGLDPGSARIIGYLPDHLVISGFRVTPVLALVTPPLDLVLNPDEVAEVFEVPVDYLFDVANHKARLRRVGDEEMLLYDITWNEKNIWGATAGMLLTFARMLREGVGE